MERHRSPKAVFIVRLWQEPHDFANALPVWRGDIECVNSQTHRFVQGFDDVTRFMNKQLSSLKPDYLPRWQLPPSIKQ